MRLGAIPVILLVVIAGCSGGGGIDDAGGGTDDAGGGIGSDIGGGADGGLPADSGEADGGADPVAALAAQVERSRIEADLATVAIFREPGSAGWQKIQDLCADRLASLGFTVERQDYGSGTNVVGVKPGDGTTERQVLVSAHYDHIAGCAGADDNATGVAGLLETARVLAGASFERTLVVACWDEEERGLIGAHAYAARAKERRERIEAALVYDCVGFTNDAEDSQQVPAGLDLLFPEQDKWIKRHRYRADFLTLLADDSAHDAAASFVARAVEIDLPAVALELTQDLKMSSLTAELRRSDHAAFWFNDYPAVMITDTAELRDPYYHCRGGPDAVETLDIDFAAAVVRATTAVTADLLHVKE